MDVSKPSSVNTNFHYVQDQLGNKEVWSTNNLEVPGLSFKNMLQAKVLVGEQNVFTATQNPLPPFLQMGRNVNTKV